MEGWIKVHRKILKWEWFKTPNMLHLFEYLLLSANHEENEWQGIKIKRGQFVTGLNSIYQNTGISIQSARTCIKRLKSTGEITIKSTNKYSIITIINYDSYQLEENITNNQINKQANKQLTNNQQTTNNKQEYKKEKKEKKEIPSPNKSVDFIDQIIDCFVEEYGDYEIISKGKERSAAGKILSLYKKQQPNQTSEETLQGLQIFFRQCMNITEPWLYDNMSLPIIVNQWNKIKTILRNGNTTKKQKGATPNEIAGVVAKHFATDY